MRLNVLAPFVAGVLFLTVPASAQVRVTIDDGRVSISAHEATTRQILTEWARVGQTKIVNIDRVSGAPMTLELTNVSETQALDTLLRSLGGYLAAPRAQAQPNASRYDRIYLMTSGAAAGPSLPPRPVAGESPRPGFVQAPVFLPPDNSGDDDPLPTPVPVTVPNVPPPPNGTRPTVFSAFPPPQQPEPDQAPQKETPSAQPTAPAGVARPGMVVPAPPQPGQDRNVRNPR